ncbi:MAG: response regulator transcription factor [Proteocatella sp.]
MEKAVLVVDDEKEIRKIIKTYLMQSKMAVLEAADGSEALRVFENEQVDLIILDVMMPKMDGWQTCKEIRKKSKVPIIMLTARGEEYDKLFGFELGVDDYVVKPFSPRELMARVKAVFQRIDMFKAEDEIYIIEELKINIKSRVASISEEELILTPKEYELLSFFVKNKGIVFSRDKILDEVWGYEFVGDSRTVDTHVKILREKLGKKRSWISTIWGVGYKFEPGEKV